LGYRFSVNTLLKSVQTILSPQTIHLTALMHIGRCKTLVIAFILLDVSDKLQFIEHCYFQTPLACDFPDVLKLNG